MKIIEFLDEAALAQLVEHIIRNDGVGCSNHPSGTIFIKSMGYKGYENNPCNQFCSVEEISRIIRRPDVINLAIPLNQPISQSVKRIRELVAEKQTMQLKERGVDKKKLTSLNQGLGKYQVSTSEFKGSACYTILPPYRH